jgi:UDPglucose 6-dehydrogenase
MTKIVIQGKGTVGLSTEMFLRHYIKDVDVVFNDPFKGVVVNQEDWLTADYVAVCVNTDLDESLPLPENNIKNVIEAISHAVSCGFNGQFLVRSTIGVEDAVKLVKEHGTRVIMWPEYIREALWQLDSIAPRVVLLGGDAENFALLFDESYQGPVIITEPVEAMLAKLSTNAFLSTKVIFANQVRQLCETYGLDYGLVSQLLANEGRLGESHWASPGPDGQAGFGGKCFPKDMKTFETALIKAGLPSNMAQAVLDLNKQMRP